jgi:hypothetical protein
MIPASVLELLDRITPAQCRAIARSMASKGTPLTMVQIAATAGMTIGRAQWIARQQSWELIPVGDAQRFMLGCGITLRNQRRHLFYIRRTAKAGWPMAHLFKHRGRTLASIRRTLG